jgi:hypothetical protein
VGTLRVVGFTLFGAAYAPWFVVEAIGLSTDSEALISLGLPVYGAARMGIDTARTCLGNGRCWAFAGLLFADAGVQLAGGLLVALANDMAKAPSHQRRNPAFRWMVLPSAAPAGASVAGRF